MLSCKNKNTLERPFFAQLDMKTNVVCCMGSLFQIQQSDFNATFLGHPSTQLALRVLTSPASQQSTMRRARASQRARSSQSRITSATPGARSCSAASALFPVREYGSRPDISILYIDDALVLRSERALAPLGLVQKMFGGSKKFEISTNTCFVDLILHCHSNIHPPNYPLCPDT